MKNSEEPAPPHIGCARVRTRQKLGKAAVSFVLPCSQRIGHGIGAMFSVATSRESAI